MLYPNKRALTELLPHQVENFKQLHCRMRALLSEKAGRGKTYVALFSWWYLHQCGVANKLFVVCPVNAYDKKVWQKQSKAHFSSVTSISFDELNKCTMPQLLALPHDVIVLKYTSVKYNDKQAYQLVNSLFLNAPQGKMNVVVFDEVHKLKSWDSQVSKIWKACTKNIPILWGLTATTYSTDYSDTYQIINFIKPYILGTFEDFKRQCCVVEEYFQPGAGWLDRIVGLHTNVFFGKLRGLLIVGQSSVIPHFHIHKYSMSDETRDLYIRVANGLASFPSISSDEKDHESSMKALLSTKDENLFTVRGSFEDAPLVNISKNSSGYVYLQYVTDGAVNADGDFTPTATEKLRETLGVLQDIYSRGRSCVIYAHYYKSLDVIMEACRQFFPKAILMENSSRSRMEEDALLASAVKNRPHFVFITAAGSESVSFGFISDVLLYNTPTTPSMFSQVVGRILRVDTTFPDDQHVHLLVSSNIDGYKLLVVSAKAKQADLVQGEDLSIPNIFKNVDFSSTSWEKWKSQLLWGAKSTSAILDL